MTILMMLLSQPQVPRSITILCREVHRIRQRSQEDISNWQLELTNKLQLSPEKIHWTDHSGFIHPTLKQLIQHSSPTETWEQPKELEYDDIYVASSLMLERDHALGHALSYPLHWSDKDIREVYAQPTTRELLIQLEPNLELQKIEITNHSNSILKSLAITSGDAQTLEWPTEPTQLKLLNGQGKLLTRLDLPPSPQHPLDWSSSTPLTLPLTHILESFHTYRPQRLFLSHDSRDEMTSPDETSWVFLGAQSPLTSPLPSGLPRVAQSSSRLATPILHAPFDWSITPWPTHQLLNDKANPNEHTLISASNFPLVIQKKLKRSVTYLSFPSNVEVQNELWSLLLESAFPMDQLHWSRLDSKRTDFTAPSHHIALLSTETKLFLALCSTFFFTACLFLGKRHFSI